MKKTIVTTMIALAVSALFTTADARNTRVITGNSTANCSSTTVLDGSWSINTHADGTLLILDKNNTIVRMIADGGTTFIAEKGKDTPDVSTPITLMVDKCGNLHITDNTAFTTGSRAPFALPHEANGWGDPEAAPATHENGTNTIVKR